MPRRMRALASFVTGRRTKFVVLGLWIVLAVVFSPLGSKLADETKDDTASFLPESAESTEVVNLLDDRFADQETSQGLIVYQRDGGLTEADKQKIAEDAAALEALARGRAAAVAAADGRRSRPGSPKELVSEDELARLHRAHPADRLRERRPTGASGPRDHRLGGRRDADPAHRRHRLQHRRRRGLLRHRHEAAVRDRAPGAGPARRDLPLGAGGADAADRRLPRLHGRQRVHLPAGEERRDRLLELAPRS